MEENELVSTASFWVWDRESAGSAPSSSKPERSSLACRTRNSSWRPFVSGRECRTKNSPALENLDQLRQHNTIFRHERETFEDQLSEIQSSLGWFVMSRLRSLRVKVFRPGTLRGRCWTLASRFVRTAGTAGSAPPCAGRERVVRKIRKFGGSRRGVGTRFLAHVFRQNVPVDRFRELPWRFFWDMIRRHPVRPVTSKFFWSRTRPAARETQVLCLLRLAKELSKLPRRRVFCGVAARG